MKGDRLAIAAGCVLAALPSAVAGVDWRFDVQKSLADAQERGRPLLILFRPADCGDRTAPGQTDALGRPLPGREPSECQRMDEDAWSTKGFAAEAQRFVALRAMEGSDRTLATRYRVARLPTMLFADPWGNEIVRVIGYLPREKLLRLMRAVPSEFGALSEWGPRLRGDPTALDALLAAGQFYAAANRREFAERYFELASSSPQARTDAAAVRELTVARGLNLLQMNRARDAARLFEQALAGASDDAGADVLLFGLVSAHLAEGDLKAAESAQAHLERRFPASPFTRRGRENLARSRAGR